MRVVTKRTSDRWRDAAAAHGVEPWGLKVRRPAGRSTHHADFKGIEQVEGQRGHQVDDEPRGQVMDADLPGVEDHLARLADVAGAEIKNDICEGGNKKVMLKCCYNTQVCINNSVSLGPMMNRISTAMSLTVVLRVISSFPPMKHTL